MSSWKVTFETELDIDWQVTVKAADAEKAAEKALSKAASQRVHIQGTPTIEEVI